MESSQELFTKTLLEKVNNISKEIIHKLSEVNDASHSHIFLMIQKQTLDNALQKIVDDFQKTTQYDYELYSLYDKMETLRNKIYAKGPHRSEDDEDMKEYKELKAQHTWIQRIKAKSC